MMIDKEAMLILLVTLISFVCLAALYKSLLWLLITMMNIVFNIFLVLEEKMPIKIGKREKTVEGIYSVDISIKFEGLNAGEASSSKDKETTFFLIPFLVGSAIGLFIF